MTTATKTRAKQADAPATSPEPARFVLTASLADLAKQKRDETHEFALTSTMPGAFATVRVPDLGDPDILTMLPDQLLRDMLVTVNGIEANENGTGLDISKPDEVDIERLKANAKQSRALADAYCVAGFVDPPLAYTERDQKTTAHVLLEAIHPADRARFFNWCNAQGSGATATVTAFPDGSAEDMAVGGPGGVDSDATEPPAESVPDGNE
jgi:hypothetical protein